MADWVNKYREENIPTRGSIGGTITAHIPGKKIAKAITELQERVVTDLDLNLEGIEDTGSQIDNNTLILRLKGAPEGGGLTENVSVVSSGEWPLLSRQTISIENGLIKSISGDDSVQYPAGELLTGSFIAFSAKPIVKNMTVTITYEVIQVSEGIVVGQSSGSWDITLQTIGDTKNIDVINDVIFDATGIKFQSSKLFFENGLLIKTQNNEYKSIPVTNCET